MPKSQTWNDIDGSLIDLSDPYLLPHETKYPVLFAHELSWNNAWCIIVLLVVWIMEVLGALISSGNKNEHIISINRENQRAKETPSDGFTGYRARGSCGAPA